LSPNSNIRLKPLKLTVFFLFFPIIFFGQTLTGLWTGVMTNDSNTIRKDVSLEIALTEYRGKVYGYSCSEFIINDTLYYIVKRVKGTIDGDVCEVKDDDIISYNFHGKLDKGIKVIHTFRMNKEDSSWHLEGGWKTNTTKKYYALTGKTALKEEKDMANSKLFPHLEELSLANDVPFYKEQKREQEIIAITKPVENNIAKNISINKPDVVAKNKTSLTAIENADENKKETEEANVVFTERKKENPVNTIPSETKKTDLSVNNSIETKKPSVSESLPPFIEKKEDPAAIVQVEQKKPDPPVAVTTQTEIKNTPTTNNNSTEIKNNQLIVASNNNATKKDVPVNPVQQQIKKSTPENNNITVVKKDQPLVVSNSSTNQKKEPTTIPVQTESKKIEPSLTSTQPDDKKITAPINPVIENKKVDQTFASAATNAAERKSAKTQTVFFKSDSLELVLYDNGEVDGDTVSVLMNGEVIIPKQCLKAVAYKKMIYIPHDSNDSTVLVLYAENLGKYPPNTGLLIVHDGDDSYNVHFTADLQTNAAIILRRKSK
jgi:hypothetical protein